MASYSEPAAEFVDDTEVALAMNWWLPVVFGVLLILYSFVVLSFTIETVWAIAIGMGIGLILAGIAELMSTALMSSGRFWGYVLGGLDVVLGILALAWPQATFVVLVRLVAWVLLIHGVVDFVRSLEQRHARLREWWLTLLAGLASIAVAFWAIRYVGRSTVILVLWVGIALLMRGIDFIMTGFNLRGGGRLQLATA
jgi:uncharacterized membrane protein HdeD (DUF308 family)